MGTGHGGKASVGHGAELNNKPPETISFPGACSIGFKGTERPVRLYGIKNPFCIRKKSVKMKFYYTQKEKTMLH